MKTKILTTAILLFCSLILSGQVIHVPGDQPSIQAGINAANNGDIVLVDTGVYYENIDFLGKAITIASHYLNQKDSSFIFNTIINGSQNPNPDIGSVVSFVNGEDTTSCLYGFTITGGTGSVVPFIIPVRAGGGINITFSGCKIESNIIKENECIIDEIDGMAAGGGISSGPPAEGHYLILRKNLICYNTVWTKGIVTNNEKGRGMGGGVVIAYDCIVEENFIYSNICKSEYGFTVGGAIRMQDDGTQIIAEIISNTIYNNESVSTNSNAFGGGISCSGANTIIENNEIMNNKTEGLQSRGSGIYFDLVDTYFADVYNNVITGNYCVANSSYCYGGAIGMYRSYDINIVNNLITENSAKYGGAIYITESNPTLINNTISENIAEVSGGGIYFYDAASGAIIMNTILWNDSANGQPNEIHTPNPVLLEIAYSDIKNGWEGEGNICEDPLFIGSGNHPYSLQDESPCVNTGTPDTTGLNLPEFDLAGNPRLYGGRIEMGAYENPNVIVGLDRNVIHNKFELNAFPNPFKAETKIEFSVPKAGFVSLSVIDITGKEVEKLASKNLPSGNLNINWNAENLKEGVYFIQLETNHQTITKKVILLK